MIDEYYCSKLGMSAPDLSEIPEDFDSDEEDEFESSFVPLSEKSIKRQLKALGCYQKPRNPLAPPKTSKFSIRNLLLPPVQVDLLDTCRCGFHGPAPLWVKQVAADLVGSAPMSGKLCKPLLACPRWAGVLLPHGTSW